MLEQSQSLGFLGPGPVMFHVEHARGFVQAAGSPSALLDLGSGGGVPGLVLAVAFPLTEVVLLDAMSKRCQFLERSIAELGLAGRVSVECGRAEELGHRPDLRGRFPVVVTRSFGPPAVTAECAAGFLMRPAGRILVSEPPQPDTSRWSPQGLAMLGLATGERFDGEGTSIQELSAVEPLDPRYPRRTGVPSKRPLF